MLCVQLFFIYHTILQHLQKKAPLRYLEKTPWNNSAINFQVSFFSNIYVMFLQSI